MTSVCQHVWMALQAKVGAMVDNENPPVCYRSGFTFVAVAIGLIILLTKAPHLDHVITKLFPRQLN